MPITKRTLALALAAVFCTISAAHGADSAASARAKMLVNLMRVDDTVATVLAITIRTSCKQILGFERQCVLLEQLPTSSLAAKVGQDIDREHLSELLAPFFTAHFSGDEIEAMIAFYDSDEGRQLTGLLGKALNSDSLRTFPQLDRTTAEKLKAYLQSPVSQKFASLSAQFKDEAEHQVGPYLCTLFEPRGFSCAALTQMAGNTGEGLALLGTINQKSGEEKYQHAADIVRARHLLEWAQVIETYYKKSGHYPLQRRVKGNEILRVRIATRAQQAYLGQDSRFTPVSVKEFVADIESVLEREIDERYDPQRVPNGAPVYLSYFVTKDGYAIWAVCRTCPSRSNGFTTPSSVGGQTVIQTINIGSTWFIDNVPNTQSIESLQRNKEFVEFIGNDPPRAAWFDDLERAQVHESKN